MHPSTLAKRVFFLLVLAIICFYFYGLGYIPLVGPDEPRYAQVAREMFLRSNLVTPTLGGHTWFEKPALLYWLMIASFKLFGVHEWSARLGPALCGLLTVLAVWTLGHKVERSDSGTSVENLALWSALFAATSLGLIVFARGASFDIVVTMTTTWALCCFMCSELARSESQKRRYLAGFYLFIGLSLLAKGLVGFVIPFGVIGLYHVLRRSWPGRTKIKSLFWGIPLALLIAATWYGPVIFKHGWVFIDEFFVQHHFARYVSNKYHHPQPVYFYPAILLMLMVPWTPILIDSIIGAKNWSWRRDDGPSQIRVFAFAWVAFPILFFSFSGSKLPGYVLPVIPGAALLIGIRFVVSQPGWSVKLTGLLSILMGVVGFVYAVRFENLPVFYSALATAPFVVAGGLTFVLNRSSASLAIATAVLTSLIVVLNHVAPVVSQRESTRDLLRQADALGYSHLSVLALRGDDRSAEFYASGRVIYGADTEVFSLDEAPQLVADIRKRGEKILAFIPSERIEQFNVPGVDVIGNNGKLALLILY